MTLILSLYLHVIKLKECIEGAIVRDHGRHCFQIEASDGKEWSNETKHSRFYYLLGTHWLQDAAIRELDITHNENVRIVINPDYKDFLSIDNLFLKREREHMQENFCKRAEFIFIRHGEGGIRSLSYYTWD